MNDPVMAQLYGLVGTAGNAEALRSLRDQIQQRMQSLLPSASVEQFNNDLNGMHDALIARGIYVAEQEMARMGMGSPPVPYAYLLFGSGGRREQTLASDQDSGMLYDNPPASMDGGAVKQYFYSFSQVIVKTLQQIGYPPCEGNVISSNPDWCDSLQGWMDKLDRWFEIAHWEVVRYLLIIADGRMVCGDRSLADRLKEHYFRDTLDHPVIVRRMLENTLRYKVLIGVFGQLITERYGPQSGSLDIKYGAYIPLINSIRLMAIQGGIRATSTLERIRALRDAGKLSEQDSAEYASAFRLFLRLRLYTSEATDEGTYGSSGKLAGSRLTKQLACELKRGLRTGKKLQRRVYRQTLGKLK
ncbi:hypothetical protein BG53_04685 [Paenibacillus darwinianus]|uniref:Signal transduction protein n=1 Tax=Paenibacillus darwinianus TaxID=1380763 RepID=A0A9W5S033_9BACL|nr:DUF294 nucleotidyltransferase-like domain-containing protein [Paenibacillus darwinianus]EXX86979.1 hypothetical protein CH50_06140 [Paenibacillus darwinianus]EXX87193.1 hypothetical protein BG53_04685 [Paenibacillus darwinianus]EXX87213.1 hypothetical protein BG52_04650 [Paenibacillus darwinianus]